MLTTVTAITQLQLTESALTSVDMSRLKDRLTEAMGETVSRADLIQAVRAYVNFAWTRCKLQLTPSSNYG